MTQGFLLTAAGIFLMAMAFIGTVIMFVTGKSQRQRLEEKMKERYGET